MNTRYLFLSKKKDKGTNKLIGHFQQGVWPNYWVQLFSSATAINTQVRTGSQLVTRDVSVAPRNVRLIHFDPNGLATSVRVGTSYWGGSS